MTVDEGTRYPVYGIGVLDIAYDAGRAASRLRTSNPRAGSSIRIRAAIKCRAPSSRPPTIDSM
jgi:hypothetical protein